MLNWFAVYTRARFEKKLCDGLTLRGITAYAPMVKTLKQWSDRKKWVEEPLIRSYVFVQVEPVNYYDVLQLPGAVKYIFFEGKPAAIPDWQIQALKRALVTGENYEMTTEVLEKGDMVQITQGPFNDIKGELIQIRGKRKVLVRIEHTGHALLLTVPSGSVKKI